MQRGLGVSVALLAFGLFCFYCIHEHSPMIQQDVTERAKSVLAANRIPASGLSVDGRDVLLRGPAGSVEVSDATQKLVAATEGVRLVNVQTAAAAPDARTMSTKAETQGRLDSLIEQDVVEFKLGSAELTAHGRQVLDQVAPLLEGSPGVLCEIQGHTDSVGKADENSALSYRRALETKNYLVNKGIAPERLIAKGYGDTQPVASNETAAGRQKNRRIQFVLKENQ